LQLKKRRERGRGRSRILKICGGGKDFVKGVIFVEEEKNQDFSSDTKLM